MKKLILALLAVSAVTAASAQKNTILVYGSAGVSSDNTNGTTNYTPNTLSTNQNVDINNWSYRIMPGIGYQFSRNMTVGVQGGYMKDHSETLTNMVGMATQTMSNTNSEWTVGGFYRYTHYLSNIFSVYGQVNAGYLSGNLKQEATGGFNTLTGLAQNTVSAEYNGFQGELFPAFAINVHKGWALNFAVGGIRYRSLSYEPGDLGRTSFSSYRPEFSNQLDITLGQQFNLTVTKNIGCNLGRRRASGEPGAELRRMNSADDEDEDDERPRRRRSRNTQDDEE